MRLPDIFLPSEVGTFHRTFLVASAEMISNLSDRRGQLSDWTPFLVRKSYYKISEFKSWRSGQNIDTLFKEIQKQLNLFHEWCSNWGFKINEEKQ